MEKIHKNYHFAEHEGKEFREIKSKHIFSSSDTPEHMLIEADNYHALSLLQKTHQEKIDLIYIDPPYNTGKKHDFMYSDNNTQSDWLSIMNTRLQLASSLLKPSGAIFISIDDNEVAALKLLCNSIFGEQNFVVQFVRVCKKGSGNDSRHIAIPFDYMLCYAKDKTKLEFEKQLCDVSSDARYKFSDKHVLRRGKYLLRDLEYKGSYSTTLDYALNAPDGSILYAGSFFGKPHTWRWSKDKVSWGITNDFIVFKKSKSKWKVYFKQYQFVDNKDNEYVRTLPHSAIIKYYNCDGTKELKSIIPQNKFLFPKPIGLILFCINLFKDKNITVLDFFAGSGTTGHAVLLANNTDGGNRQCILCTNNENNICTSVTYPRLKRVIKGYTFNGSIIKGLGGSLRYFKTTVIK